MKPEVLKNDCKFRGLISIPGIPIRNFKTEASGQSFRLGAPRLEVQIDPGFQEFLTFTFTDVACTGWLSLKHSFVFSLQRYLWAGFRDQHLNVIYTEGKYQLNN